MAIRIDAERFYEMVYNARLYCTKSSALPPLSYWTTCDFDMSVTTSDDMVALTDWGKVETDGDDVYSEYFVPLDHLNEWERGFRTTKGPLDVESVFLGEHFKPHEEAESFRVIAQAVHEGVNRTLPDSHVGPWAVHPDRLRKLSLVKPGSYPIAVQRGWNDVVNSEVLAIKIGRVRGLIMPMEYDVLQEKYNETPEVLW